jgi:hypothetical protein
MKRLFLSVVLLATCVVATSAQIKYDVRTSLGLSSMLSPSNADTHVAFKIGADASIPIGKSRFAVEPGLFFSQKGIRFNGYYLVGDIMSDAKYSTTLNYLEMPILATSKVHIGNDSYIIFKMGPYIAYGMKGKTTMKLRDTDYSRTFGQNHFREKCDYDNAAYDEDGNQILCPKFNRFDAGVAYGIDFRIHRFIIGIEGEYGLLPVCDELYMGNTFENILSACLFGSKPKNISISFTTGYRF